VKAEEFRQFSGATVPLARLKDRVYTTEDTLHAVVEVAHYGPAPMKETRSWWRIETVAGKRIAGDNFPPLAIPRGKNISLGNVSVDLQRFDAPAQLRLVVEIQGDAKAVFRNSWNFWLYPAKLDSSAPVGVLVTSAWGEAESKLAAGGKVLFLPKAADLDATDPKLTTVPIFWNHLMNPNGTTFLGLLVDSKHPALVGFPTETNCDWQWVDLFSDTRAVNIDELPHTLEPIVQPIDDWNRNLRLAALYECSVGPGKLMVCSFDLDARRAGAPALRRSVLDYMASDRFRPVAAVPAEELRRQWASLNPHTVVPKEKPAPSSPDLVDPGQIQRKPS
jgi:hypothetical protein